MSAREVMPPGSLFYAPVPAERLRAAEAASKAAGEAWQQDAERYVLTYGEGRETFQCEDVKSRWDAAGLPQPGEPRAWGAIFAALSRKKLIFKTGYRLDAWGSPKPVWRLASAAPA